MKCIIKILCLLHLLSINLIGETKAQENNQKFNASELFKVNWQNYDALPYKKDLSLNSSFIAFEPLEKGQTAFLSDVDNTILIYNNENGDLVNSIDMDFRPFDFTFSNNTFYVLSEKEIVLYDKSGDKKDKLQLNYRNKGINDIKVFENNIFFLNPNGTTISLNEADKVMKGWLLYDGTYAETLITNDYGYLVRWYDTNNNLIFEKEVEGDHKLACAIMVGADENNIYVDAQYIVNEHPLEVERYVEAINRNEVNNVKLLTVENEVTRAKLPDVYHTYIKRDVVASKQGLFHSISSPADVHVFKLIATKNKMNKTATDAYPESLQNMKHHFNNHLLKIDGVKKNMNK